MTDNRTTELREKLTERGIEFATDDFDHLLTTSWRVDGIFAKYLEGTSKGYLDEDDPTLKIRINRITPDQAIAATVGNGTCELVTSEHDYDSLYYHEFSCGHDIETDNEAPPSYCPECGAKVVKR